MRKFSGKPTYVTLLAVILLIVLASAASAQTNQDRINALVAAGKCGTVLQSMAMDRCAGIAAWNRPYVGDGVGDCYGYTRQVWNAILSDGNVHPEDYYPNAYNKSRWLGVVGGIPVNTYVDTRWASISSLGGTRNLLPGDIVGTTQGHRWGSDVHYGMAAGIGLDGQVWDWDCHGGYGAEYRHFYTGFLWYYVPIHTALATGAPVPVPEKPRQGSQAVLDGLNKIETFCRASDNRLYWKMEAAPDTGYGDATWLYESVNAYIAGIPRATYGFDGKMQVFARGTDGSLLYKYQNAMGSYVFSDWFWEGNAPIVTDPIPIMNVNGCVEVFAIGGDGSLLWKVQNAPGSIYFSDWLWEGASTAVSTTNNVAVVRDGVDLMEVFARGNDGSLMWKMQNSPGSYSFTNWIYEGFSTPIASDPVAIMNKYGCIEVFALAADGGLLWKVQNTPHSVYFSDWLWEGFNVNMAPGSQIAVVRNANDCMEVFARGSDGGLMWKMQNSPGSYSFTDWMWEGANANIAGNPVALKNNVGKINVYGRDGANGVLWKKQNGTGSWQFSNWLWIGGAFPGF